MSFFFLLLFSYIFLIAKKSRNKANISSIFVRPRDDHVFPPVQEGVDEEVAGEDEADEEDDEPEDAVGEGEEGAEDVVDAVDGRVLRVLPHRVHQQLLVSFCHPLR